jgi:hypothetical protein
MLEINFFASGLTLSQNGEGKENFPDYNNIKKNKN